MAASTAAPKSSKRSSPRAAASPIIPALSPAVAGAASSSSASAKPTAHRLPRKPSVGKQPLLPLTEARHYHHGRSTSRAGPRETESEKWDTTWDNPSAARDGRQFAVANVGNNGRIYLRPSVRRKNSVPHTQQSFNLPTTPPQSFDSPPTSFGQGRIPIRAPDAPVQPWVNVPQGTPLTSSMASLPGSRAASRQGRHRRALSDSTIHELTAPKTADSPAPVPAPKTSIDDLRPRTMDDFVASTPHLDISIPNWRLGTPRFTDRGTALIRGASYAPTEELRSSSASMLNSLPRSRQPTTDFTWNKSTGSFLSPGDAETPAIPRSPNRPPSSLRLQAMPPTHPTTELVIEPAMFTDLTFRPACDDRRLVRYAPTTGAVAAATPPRLVAEITSPSFLDYELISDFFLTYRSFLDSLDLLRMLFARMRWALDRQDEVGMIVRVRTFVATRHWILNYFTDDFLLNYDLRKDFCDSLNSVVEDLSEDVQTRTGQLRVIAELKKCWRRVCAHYWDGPNFDGALGVEAAVMPGGIAGHRDPTLTPSYWQSLGGQPPLSSALVKHQGPDVGFSTDPNKTPRIGDFIVFGDRPLTPENVAMDLARAQGGSPRSPDSVDVVSCPFPGKTLKSMPSYANPQWSAHPHPVQSTAQAQQTGVASVPPRALASKRTHHGHSHKRSNSVNDSLREHLAEKPPNDVDFPTLLPPAGSLVRGNILPPGQPFVDTSAQDCGGMAHRQTTVFTPPSRRMFKDKAFHGAMSGIGMKKLLASVRRALSARGHVTAPTQANLTRISPVGPRNVASSRLPGTAVVPQEEAQHHGGRPAVRIDLLGAEVAEDFKKAVREEQAEAPIPPGPLSAPLPGASSPGFRFGGFPAIEHQRPTSDMGITTGSKSIVIVDDTVQFEMPRGLMLQHAQGHSIETLMDSFIPAAVDPTPPNTPPSVDRGTPRRSSYLIHPRSVQSPDVLPPFIPDLATLQQDDGSPISEAIGRPSFASSRQTRRYPPVSAAAFRMHKRVRSSKTHQSIKSISHRRHSSINSGTLPPSTILSLDPATLSDISMRDSEIPVPEPLHVLRRRPGGDLRAANRVGELDNKPLRRSQSVGSIVTYSESVRSMSFFGAVPDSNLDADSDYGDYCVERHEVFSVGQLTKQQPEQAAKLSLFSTHSSSKPPGRPSFEAEAQRLAQIPDDEDDGGIESALLKLEGKFQRGSKGSAAKAEDEEIDIERLGRALQFLGGAPAESIIGRRRRASTKSTASSMDPGTTEDLSVPRSEGTEARSFLSEASVDSNNLIPLLDRGLTDGGSPRLSRSWAEKSILRDSEDLTTVASSELSKTSVLYDAQSVDEQATASGDQEYDLVEKTDSMDRIIPGDTQPASRDQQSFLEDESYASSDISSEMSTEEPMPLQTSNNLLRPRRKLPPRPLGEPITDSMLQPASPPLSTPRQRSPLFNSTEAMYASRPLPPTPEATPTVPFTQTLTGSQPSPAALTMTRGAPLAEVSANKFSVHLPFILAFDSDILAQQFTLIEKDALNEIDWKELIEMNWKNATSSGSRSWVDFLRNSDAHGVEVVIARFNIMVKWAISEIVLTQHVEERARCIIKMIHVAAHCRRYRNFATLAQLTIALSSNDVTRLTRTWAMVPAHDLRTLAELEALVTPTRNFLHLRAEMEVGTDTGCIPFVGIYTHDLLYNAQRPSEVPAAAPDAPQLVNLERCRVAAAVVKVLLRLLESSTRYAFQPIEGITERCLWVGALSDEEIRSHSEALES
ncbi:low temperature essential 1 [Cordyceps fumosorosea ARSEF 2679]|uniref:Low temperature essential 1 n=1 Tax=Cordyceps fumosorosea (strain ARSEF 2679) TaxID=1081104 RepID=A0A167W0Z0_CORFA|nr:low temperature essential 1 [Cordyceps fumosorosea ARSEF 2679]OAA63198.1 low temperature essential 1 [Cordyceps fumosorosea ARSEF 2679]